MVPGFFVYTVSMLTESDVLEFLEARYHPTAIILYGSRSRPDATATSDWDLLVVMPNIPATTPGKVEIVQGERLDCEFCNDKEFADPEFMEQYFAPFITGKALKDTNGKAAAFLADVQERFSKGRNLTAKQIEDRKGTYTFFVTKLQGYVDHPVAFEIKQTEILSRMLRYWMEIKKNTWSKNPRAEMIEIKEQDPWFYEKMVSLTREPYARRMEILQECCEYLFGANK